MPSDTHTYICLKQVILEAAQFAALLTAKYVLCRPTRPATDSTQARTRDLFYITRNTVRKHVKKQQFSDSFGGGEKK